MSKRCGFVEHDRAGRYSSSCRAKANAGSGACPKHERYALRTALSTDNTPAGQIVRNMVRDEIEREQARRIAVAATNAVRKAAELAKKQRRPVGAPTATRPKVGKRPLPSALRREVVSPLTTVARTTAPKPKPNQRPKAPATVRSDPTAKPILRVAPELFREFHPWAR